MKGVAPPQHRNVGGLGGRLQGAVEPPEPVGGELLAADLDVGEPATTGVAREITGLEGVNVDEAFEVVVIAAGAIVAIGGAASGMPGGAGPQGAAPGRSQRVGPALGHRGDPVAQSGGLAGEHDPPAGAQNAVKLGE